MEKQCLYCKQNIIFNHKNQFSAHCRNCKCHPNYEKSLNKIKNRPTKKTTYTIICKKCNIPFNINITKHKYNIGKYKKYCSYKCSNSHEQTQEINKKRSNTIINTYNKNPNKYFKKREKRQCMFCNNTFECIETSKRKICYNKKCIKEKQGYTIKKYINYNGKYIPSRKNKKYKDLHRIIMEEYLKRPLLSIEFVHHKNGNKQDNRIENLQLMSNSEHSKLHNPKKNY